MIDIQIPGYKDFHLQHLVLDFNGTLACDGVLLNGVKELLNALAEKVTVHILTADTFGRAGRELEGISVTLVIMPPDAQDEGKRQYIQHLGADTTVALGNGRNDRLMIADAALGIAIVQDEGAAAETVAAADVICRDAVSALKLLSYPKRLVATLRS